jgi:dextranase
MLTGTILSALGIMRLPGRLFARVSWKELGVANPSLDHQLTIEDLWPDRASYTPGAAATIHVALKSPTASSIRVDLRVRFLDQEIGVHPTTISIPAGTSELRFPLNLPPGGFRGYGIDLMVFDTAGTVLATASTALDVLEDWTQAPRYGFLSDFAPGDPFAAANVHALARYHVNVVQFYDWMWRHYVLMPPTEEFTDGMGRTLSLKIVREKVDACKAEGMAAMGYAAVYGAEPEYALEHRDQMLYDSAGKPYSIEQLFYVMNIHLGNPWRAKILVEMARAVRDVPFDGLHLDQYGFPKSNAYGPGPNPRSYDLAEDFPPFIDDARRAIRAARPGTRVIFNAVENWPIAAVAPTSQDATYIEVWPPYENYSDLQMLILEARRLAPAKQVILAAYLAPLQGALDDALPPAERATRLASAAIWANGGFHLLMGERNGALCHAYYPNYATLMPDFAQVMRRYYDFVVRYENVLSDQRLTTVLDHEPATVAIAGHRCSSNGEAGAIWAIRRSMPGFVTLSLINLASIQETHWNAAKPPVHALHNLAIDWGAGVRVTSLFVADPDGLDQSAHTLPYTTNGEGTGARIHFEIPRLEYWTLVVARVAE